MHTGESFVLSIHDKPHDTPDIVCVSIHDICVFVCPYMVNCVVCPYMRNVWLGYMWCVCPYMRFVCVSILDKPKSG